MDCTRCHRDIAPDASFCPLCGTPQQGDPSRGASARRLSRIPADAKVAGVCAGIADYLDVDVTLVRAAWLALSIVPGAIVGGVVAYVLAWMVMPEGTARPSNGAHRLTRSVTDVKLAGVCGGIADYFGVDSTPVRVAWIVLSVLPGAVFGGVVAYIAAWLIVPKAPTVVLSSSQSHAA